MISKRIWCSSCGHEGPRETAGALPSESVMDMFISEGHDPYSGKLYFRCPRCKVFITIDPADALRSGTINGYPNPLEAEAARLSKAQNFLPVWGGMYTGFALFVIVTKLLC
ncbi:MAG: hypothetical protein A4E66_00692 [Syntrophus sp. PtaB.Bin001]|nr:MAG: hypothetical protein A4E66_00692 [Syntrophus sp. PtaB.Bin001]